MGGCAKCGGKIVDGVRRHAPTCDFYRPVDMLAEHPDLIDWEADAEYWFGDDWTGPAPKRKGTTA